MTWCVPCQSVKAARLEEQDRQRARQARQQQIADIKHWHANLLPEIPAPAVAAAIASVPVPESYPAEANVWVELKGLGRVNFILSAERRVRRSAASGRPSGFEFCWVAVRATRSY